MCVTEKDVNKKNNMNQQKDGNSICIKLATPLLLQWLSDVSIIISFIWVSRQPAEPSSSTSSSPSLPLSMDQFAIIQHIYSFQCMPYLYIQTYVQCSSCIRAKCQSAKNILYWIYSSFMVFMAQFHINRHQICWFLSRVFLVGDYSVKKIPQRSEM